MSPAVEAVLSRLSPKARAQAEAELARQGHPDFAGKLPASAPALPVQRAPEPDMAHDPYDVTGGQPVPVKRKGKAKRNMWTDEQIAHLRLAYASPYGFSLKKLSELLGKTEASIACKAGHIGISGKRGEFIRTEEARENMSKAQSSRAMAPEEFQRRSESTKRWQAINGHPRGFKGKHHTPEAKAAISAGNVGQVVPLERKIKRMKTNIAKYGCASPAVAHGSWKSAWREIGGKRKFFRSRWEANYARYLEFQKVHGLITDWHHECDTFWFEGIKRGCMTYLPDFKVTNLDGSIEYHEVKGWMDAASKTKIRRMAKYHPTVILKVFDSKWYNSNKQRLSRLIQGWE